MLVLNTIFWITGGASLVFWVLSLFNVAPEPRALRRAITGAPFADRECFTNRGWRYRNAALSCFGLALIAILLHALV